ncbi:MAG: YgiQ family radical SAM protein, partial [Desulfovibrio sp.]|nr:YgiQ family radical SAM protein [Desulfovibrio sp.]
MSAADLGALGWAGLDVLLVSGDAYVDHPAFGCALLGRWLISHGFRTGLVCQPRWDKPDDLLVMGRPRLFAGISAGALDSMLAHYTAFRKKRHDDAYTPGGKAGKRPNRASLVYANLARRAFPGLPLVLGGIEASLRRATHYDFWTDALRRPLLMDAKADLLVWGMGERAILACAQRLDAVRGDAAGARAALRGIPGTAWLEKLDAQGRPAPEDAGLAARLSAGPLVRFPSHAEIMAEPVELLRLAQAMEEHVHRAQAWAFEPVDDRCVVFAPPAAPLSEAEMDALYSLPFRRAAHPAYDEPIPAAEMLATSLTSHRGCGGGCAFCSIALHQGRRVSSRSRESILDEARALGRAHAGEKHRRGSRGVAVSDVGGPTANMWRATCARAKDGRPPDCHRKSCCFPAPCPSFRTPQGQHVELLRAVGALPGISSVRVASGVRPDIALREPAALAAYAREFTGGQLKVAPEHSEPGVLARMRKPGTAVLDAFLEVFARESRKAGREQYVIPYLMSAYPGCTDEDMRALSRWLRRRGWNPRQTQCFIPTPGTVATAMFYCGRDEAGEAIPVARSDAERLRQHAILMGPETGRTPAERKKGAPQDARTTPRRHGARAGSRDSRHDAGPAPKPKNAGSGTPGR